MRKTSQKTKGQTSSNITPTSKLYRVCNLNHNQRFATPDGPLYVRPMTPPMADDRSTTRRDIILSQVVMSHRVHNIHHNRHLGVARLRNICDCDRCYNRLTYIAMCGGSTWICIAVRSCPWRRFDAISLLAIAMDHLTYCSARFRSADAIIANGDHKSHRVKAQR